MTNSYYVKETIHKYHQSSNRQPKSDLGFKTKASHESYVLRYFNIKLKL